MTDFHICVIWKNRKNEVSSSIEEQGKLTEEISAALEKAVTLVEVEDIYRPFKPKRKTRASVARDKGLEPLQNLLLNNEYRQRSGQKLKSI